MLTITHILYYHTTARLNSATIAINLQSLDQAPLKIIKLFCEWLPVQEISCCRGTRKTTNTHKQERVVIKVS